MTAVLNQESSNPIVLNDFYEYDIDSYQNGVIEYPFSNLEEGTHTLTVKVWDVFNNSSESTTEFRVISVDNLSIQNLINYPNPVVDFTSFYFEHNQSDLDMKVNLVIMDISGKVVKIIEDNINPVGFRYGPINWDGKSNEGDKLKSGMYIYNIVAKASDGEVSTKSGRLILID
jgi:flagellar hook assembly protein FlgD